MADGRSMPDGFLCAVPYFNKAIGDLEIEKADISNQPGRCLNGLASFITVL